MRTLGGRSVGSELDPEIYEAVLTGEEYFTEDQVIQETNYYAYYLPLFNSDGTVVGAISQVSLQKKLMPTSLKKHERSASSHSLSHLPALYLSFSSQELLQRR